MASVVARFGQQIGSFLPNNCGVAKCKGADTHFFSHCLFGLNCYIITHVLNLNASPAKQDVWSLF